MSHIIVALDMESGEDALALVDRLPDPDWVKVGPTLYLREGPRLIDALKARGLRVFLDLKWHDIPHQVAGAVRSAAASGVDLATVHLSGGRPMLESAVENAGSMRVAGVSVLTSHTPETYAEAIGRSTPADVDAEVERLVTLGAESGVAAFVCSPLEVARVARLVGSDCWRIVPGIRWGDGAHGDQNRTGGPAETLAAGATHLVVGRPIWRADSPAAVYAELQDVLNQ